LSLEISPYKKGDENKCLQMDLHRALSGDCSLLGNFNDLALLR